MPGAEFARRIWAPVLETWPRGSIVILERESEAAAERSILSSGPIPQTWPRSLTGKLIPANLLRELTHPPEQSSARFSTLTPRPFFRFEIRIPIALIIFGAILMATNPWFTMVDDEIAIIDVA